MSQELSCSAHIFFLLLASHRDSNLVFFFLDTFLSILTSLPPWSLDSWTHASSGAEFFFFCVSGLPHGPRGTCDIDSIN